MNEMNQRYFIKYRGKGFSLTKEAYNHLQDDFLFDPEELCHRAIDLFLEANVEFTDLHLYMSIKSDGNHIINFMAMGDIKA